MAFIATLTSAAGGEALTERSASIGVEPVAARPVEMTTTTMPPAPVTTAPALIPTAPPSESPIGTLRAGNVGPRTLELQRQLTALGYWLGEADGTYGDLTVQAVTALQKMHGMTRDGIAGPAVASAIASAIASGTRPAAARSRGDALEVDKERQVLHVVRDGEVVWTLHVSSGTGKPYRVNGRTEIADTPDGQWTVSRAHDGVRTGELGRIYRPRYFHQDGIAVHGFASVPAFAASHGCVRVSKPAMDWIWTSDVMPIGTTVFVY